MPLFLFIYMITFYRTRDNYIASVTIFVNNRAYSLGSEGFLHFIVTKV